MSNEQKQVDVLAGVSTHEQGAIEIRATFLSHVGNVPHAFAVHVVDADGVLSSLKKIKGCEDVATTLTHLLELGEAAAAAHPDADAIVITPANVSELVPGGAKKTKSKKGSGPQPPAAGKTKSSKKKPGTPSAGGKKSKPLDPSSLPLPGASGPPGYPPSA